MTTDTNTKRTNNDPGRVLCLSAGPDDLVRGRTFYPGRIEMTAATTNTDLCHVVDHLPADPSVDDQVEVEMDDCDCCPIRVTDADLNGWELIGFDADNVATYCCVFTP